MNRQKKFKKPGLTRKNKLPLLIMAILFMVVGAYFLARTNAASNVILVSPATTSKYVGETFSVQVRITASAKINAAFVDMNYNANGLQVTNIQRGADFPNQNAVTQHTVSGSTGTIKMQSTRNSSSTGSFHYATITFKAKAAGAYNFTPLTSSYLIDYGGEVPFNPFTIASGRYTFTNKPPTQQPPPNNSGPPPIQSPPPAPPSTSPSINVPTTESALSPSNLKISDFNISDVSYRSGVVTWTTSKPASSKVNYGFNSDNMPNEIVNEELKTAHEIVIEGETILAGNSYAIRITSDDGGGPVTLDAEFTTRSIGIVVLVTDAESNPVEGATVSSGSSEETTDSEGRAVFVVSEGDILITASKDDLYGEITTQIAVPQADNESSQQIDITLGESFEIIEDEPAEGGGGSKLWIIFPILLILGLIAFFVIRRRRRQPDMDYVPVAPVAHVQNDSPDMSQVHHATLQELVSQGMAADRQQAQAQAKAVTPPQSAPATPSAPQTAPPLPQEPVTPTAPTHTPAPAPAHKTASAPSEPAKPSKAADKKAASTQSPKPKKATESEPEQGVLRIKHD